MRNCLRKTRIMEVKQLAQIHNELYLMSGKANTEELSVDQPILR